MIVVSGSRPLTETLLRCLEGNTLGGKLLPRGLIVAEALVESMIIHALRGNFRFMKEILDRVEGPVRAQAPAIVSPRFETPNPALEGLASRELATWRNEQLGRLERLLVVSTPGSATPGNVQASPGVEPDVKAPPGVEPGHGQPPIADRCSSMPVSPGPI
jgi:hypothetical protein